MSTMMIVITYDVNTETPDGIKRLRNVAKTCERYGMRVQHSVFEVLVDGAQLAVLKESLLEIIDATQDTVRFYHLGSNYQKRIERIGCTPVTEVGKELIL